VGKLLALLGKLAPSKMSVVTFFAKANYATKTMFCETENHESVGECGLVVGGFALPLLLGRAYDSASFQGWQLWS
jgi:hypothetical protein